MEESLIVIRDTKFFYFYFDWPEVVEKKLKHETEYTVKNN